MSEGGDMTEVKHETQRVEMRYIRGLGIEHAFLVGCPACGDRRTGYGDQRIPNTLVREHNKEKVT